MSKKIMFPVLLMVMLFLSANSTFASGPTQTAPTPGELTNTLQGFLTLLISFVVGGGGVAYTLQLFPQWVAWKSPFKGFIVLAITAVVGATLTALLTVVTPDNLAFLPQWALAFLGFIAVYVGSQFFFFKGQK